MQEITVLTDFYGRFQSKVPSEPYASGLDLPLLEKAFQSLGIQVNYKRYAEIQFKENYKNQFFLYTSIEDPGGYYKDYIEDILLGLKEVGAILIPDFIYFKAHENKVFMEILRKIIMPKSANNIKSEIFGSIKDYKECFQECEFPLVLKKASGSASKGVFLAKDKRALLKVIRKLSNTYDYRTWVIDFIFHKKLLLSGKSYRNRFTLYRKKFIIQEHIERLDHDYKVLIFGKKYYVLKRLTRKNDFRASGSHRFFKNKEFSLPDGLLDACKEWYDCFNVPNISIDVAERDGIFYLIEFQFVNFGTYTHSSSEFYYYNIEESWQKVFDKIDLEEVYAESIKDYLIKNNLYKV